MRTALPAEFFPFIKTWASSRNAPTGGFGSPVHRRRSAVIIRISRISLPEVEKYQKHPNSLAKWRLIGVMVAVSPQKESMIAAQLALRSCLSTCVGG